MVADITQQSHIPLPTSALIEMGDQLHVPAALLPEERDSDTYFVGGWVSPRALLDSAE
jgi:hypothetical protein